MTSTVDGIYTAYMTGTAGQGMAMFVFFKGKIAGADMIGLNFSGEYKQKDDRIIGTLEYTMPAGTISITGKSFEEPSEKIVVPIDLPVEIDSSTTHRIETPIGPLNAKLVKNVAL